MSLESSLWSWLERDWRKVPKNELHYTRVENSAGGGMPDVEGCRLGHQFWAELKVVERPAQGEPVRAPHLRAKQVEWLHNRWLVGGRAWLLLRMGKQHFLLPGKDARGVYEGRYAEADLRGLTCCSPDSSAEDVLMSMNWERAVPRWL